MCKRILLWVSLVITVCLIGGVRADEVIIVPDAGFDDQVLDPSGYAYIGSDYTGPWQHGDGDAWIDYGYWAADVDLPALSGNNKLYGDDGVADYVYQILDETFISGATYTLSVWTGNAWAGYADGWGLYITGEDHNTHLAELIGNGPVGAWGQVSVTYTATGADAGKKIGIKMYGDTYVTFEDVTLSYNYPVIASNPNPANEHSDAYRDSKLTWESGLFAALHNVYVGGSFEDVNTATVPTGSGLDVNSLDLGRLEFGRTYFWRVDEVNGTPDKTVFKGDVWHFTVEPYSIPVPGATIAVAASSSANEFSLPEKTIDGSGLVANDMHATSAETMWFTATVDLDPWIQYEFEDLIKVDIMTVWNSNGAAEASLGWGVKDVEIAYSVDGETWEKLADATQFSRAPGSPTYNQYDEIDFGGVAAKYVRLNIKSNWGGILMSYSLSEVQFSMIPVAARTPEPASGSVDVLPNATAAWRAGREAATHTVHVSADMDAVADGSAPSVTSSTNSLDLSPLNLQLNETYYWRVDEVNEAKVPSVWAGPVWRFSTSAALVVDDFESYGNNSPDRPFQTWLDGFGYSEDEFFPVGYPGNGTGAGIGHDIWSLSSPHFDGKIMETASTIPGSGQSMPLHYNNNGGAASQTDRTWTVPQDWTVGGAATLVLYFYGSEDNTGGPLFAEINGQKVVYPDTADLSLALWHQWTIDLTSLGINLQAVTSMSLGVEGAGSGMILIDDIRLYRNAPAVSGLVTYGFNDLPDGGDALDGVHGGIDFGNGNWWGGDSWYGTTKCGYFSDDFVNVDISFTLPANASLVSIAVSADGAYS